MNRLNGQSKRSRTKRMRVVILSILLIVGLVFSISLVSFAESSVVEESNGAAVSTDIIENADADKETEKPGGVVAAENNAAEQTGEKSAENADDRSAENADDKSAENADDRSAENADDRSAENADDRSAENIDDRSAENADDRSAENIDDKSAEKTDEKNDNKQTQNDVVIAANADSNQTTYSESDVCAVGEVGYETVAAAIAANSSGTIVILKDIATTENELISVPKGKSFTLDLNGKTIASTAAGAATAFVVSNFGTMTIKDSVGGGAMTMNAAQPSAAYGYSCNVVSNYGVMTISSGKFTNTTPNGACFAVDNYNGGTLTINGGTYSATGADCVRLYCSSATDPSKVVINGGTITGARYSIYVQNPTSGNVKGSLTVNGGTLNSTYSKTKLSIYTRQEVTTPWTNTFITVNGGTLNADIAFNKYMPNTCVSITGGTFNGLYGTWPYGDDESGYITGGHFTGAEAYDLGAYYAKEGYVAVFDKDGERFTFYDSDEDDCVEMPFDVYKMKEVVVTPDAKLKYADQSADPELTYKIDCAEAKDFLTVELQRAAGTAAGDYAITAKTLKGGLDTSDPNNIVYYVPVLSENKVNLTIKEAQYIKHSETNELTEGAVVAESVARSDVELIVEHTTPTVEKAIDEKLSDKEELIFTQEVHFERDGDHVAVGEVCQDGKVKITFKVDKKYNGKTAAVYHVVSANRTDKMVKTVEDGKITVTVLSLSPFGIAILNDTLTVTNTVSGKGAKSSDEFTYTIKLDFPDSFDYNILDKDGTVLTTGTISSGDKFTLKGDQKLVISDVPVGTSYEITKTSKDNYTLSSENEKGEVSVGGSIASFTNTKKDATSGGGSDPKTGEDASYLIIMINLMMVIAFFAFYFIKNKVKAEAKEEE